jgi:uncharacterized protein (DUF2235 family)
MTKLVLFSDGTGNSSAKAEKTNVWRMFQALDQTTADQLAIYDDGVGNSSNKYLAMLGGAFGWGLKRNVLDLYMFVCRNYTVGDEIFAFGFSRGAYTIRVLIGLIASEGLVPANSEEDLQWHARRAYIRYRRKHIKAEYLSPPWLARQIRWLVECLLNRIGLHRHDEPPAYSKVIIEFIGLWDTVDAYGMPIKELRPAIHWLFWPMRFNDLKLANEVKHACHALSLDDERTTFHPIIWDEGEEEEKVRENAVPPGRIKQVWFAGSHANVGGGYPEDQLSLVSLDWLMSEARTFGLKFQPACAMKISDEKSPYARIYDSRDGLHLFYRYSPRTVSPCSHECHQAIPPIIHGSVIARMVYGSDQYVPCNLPANFHVLTPDGDLLPVGRQAEAQLSVLQHICPPATPQILNPNLVRRRTRRLKRALDKLGHPDLEAQERIQDAIWCRRLAYFASAACVLPMLLYAWFGVFAHDIIELEHEEKTASMVWWTADWIHKADKVIGGLVSDLVSDIAPYTPAIMYAWMRSVQVEPVIFILLLISLMATQHAGARLGIRIHDLSRLAWHVHLRRKYRSEMRKRSLRASHRSRCIHIILALLVASSMIFVVLTDTSPPHLRTGLTGLLAGALCLIALSAVVGKFKQQLLLKKLLNCSETAIPAISAHSFSRNMRTENFSVAIGSATSHFIAPFFFGCFLVYGLFSIANHFSFKFLTAAGMVCDKALPKSTPGVKSRITLLEQFPTDHLCWSTHLRLEAHVKYRITVAADADDWLDSSRHTDPHGFGNNNWLYFLAAPLKRRWDENWFMPIAHVGRLGGNEYPLHPCYYKLSRSDEEAKINKERKRQNETIPTKQGEFAGSERLTKEAAKLIMDGDPTPLSPRILTSEFVPDNDGELFLFVNDAVIALPGMTSRFFANNLGTATITVEPAPSAPTAPCTK